MTTKHKFVNIDKMDPKQMNNKQLTPEEPKMLQPKDRAEYNRRNNPVYYKVIADFPDNKDFPVGSIIELKPWEGIDWQYVVNDCQGERRYLSMYLDRYPHLFQLISKDDL